MTDKMNCPFCGKKLVYSDFSEQYHCVNDLCKSKGLGLPIFVWESLIDGKKAQEELNKIIAIKESVEGCCAEIQQNCLPFLFSINRDIKWQIDEEVSAIDQYMSEIDEIASITKGDKE